jgi:actin-like ATPase involved in cell morphogenesis
MDSIVVGIDLGTTNSVVAVAGHYPEKGLIFGPVTILWDEFERRTHASAVCQVDGELRVGEDAKPLAAEGFAPVRFVKKYMGTEEKFRVGNEEWSPEKVSAAVLHHLCRIAEQALGVKVSGAVITHPAYFDGLAINATKEAGRLAELDVAGLLMEPVAAAMAYTYTDPRQTLRALVYDLGGGTFDITLVERSGSIFRPRNFGGNRELGGYNFDKKIALKMLDNLRGKNYVLEIDRDHPERDPRWASLMHHAEQLKFKVSGPGAVKGDIRVSNVFKDDSKPPKAVQLTFSMTAKEFCDLIEPELASTIRETRKVLESAKMTPKDIDVLLLVGGSCRIDAVQKRLKAEIGLDPQYDEDVLDLSVAVGAAMVAATCASQKDGISLKPIPQRTDVPVVFFDGQVQPTESRKTVEGLVVTVTGGKEGEKSVITTADGAFLLDVEIDEESESHLQMTITGPGDEIVVQRSYTVAHSTGTDGPPPPPEPPKAMLPKPIYVETASGFRELAAEGVNLPFKKTESFRMILEVTEIPVDLYQEDVQLTTILLSGFSRPVPANCRMEIELEISADYKLKATASVPSAGIHKSQEVQLKPITVPTEEQLHAQFAEVRQAYAAQLENTPDGEQKARVAAEGDRVIDEITELLGAGFIEHFQVYMLLKKLYVLVKQLGLAGGLTPSRSVVEEKLDKARQMLPEAVAKRPSLKEQRLDQTIEILKDEADRAYQASNPGTWEQVNRRLDEILQMLEHVITPPSPPPKIPATVLAALVHREMAQVRQVADQKAKKPLQDNLARCYRELDAAEKELDAVDLADDAGALQKIAAIYHRHVVPAKQLADARTRSPFD